MLYPAELWAQLKFANSTDGMVTLSRRFAIISAMKREAERTRQLTLGSLGAETTEPDACGAIGGTELQSKGLCCFDSGLSHHIAHPIEKFFGLLWATNPATMADFGNSLL